MAIENEKSNGQVMAVSLPSEPEVQLPVDPKVQLPVDSKVQLPADLKVQLPANPPPATPSKKAPTNVNQTPETIEASMITVVEFRAIQARME